MTTEALGWYLYQYPQLTLPVAEGMSQSDEYADIVRRGKLPAEIAGAAGFDGSGAARERLHTPAGEIEVLYLPVREDFERFIRVMKGKCEPIPVPIAIGAMTFFNVNNWRRIHAHRAAYLAGGGKDWAAEFKRFTAQNANYRDTIVLLSRGYYSALAPEQAGYEAEAWLALSKTIRTFHEAAHVVSRTLFMQNREALRDEVIADCIGLTAATGGYDQALAARLLGVEGAAYREGGRLQNYVDPGEDMDAACARAQAVICACGEAWARKAGPVFEFLTYLEEEKIGWSEI